MIDKTMLHIIDRTVAEAKRSTKAETMLDVTLEKLAATKAEYEKLKEEVATLNMEIAKLQQTIKEKTETISYQWQLRSRIEKELEALKGEKKDDSEGTGST